MPTTRGFVSPSVRTRDVPVAIVKNLPEKSNNSEAPQTKEHSVHHHGSERLPG